MIARGVTRGDTIIELLLATTIFSLAAIGTLGVMNRGIAISQHSLEVTTVRQQIDSQAEMIRYLRDTNDPRWTDLKGMSWLASDVLPLSMTTCPQASELDTSSRHGFFVSRDSASGTFRINAAGVSEYAAAATYAQIDYTAPKAYGMWVQIARAEGSAQVAAYDVYIHACWDSLTSDLPSTLGTIVRLYDAL